MLWHNNEDPWGARHDEPVRLSFGNILRDDGQLAEATASFEQWVALTPGDPESRQRMRNSTLCDSAAFTRSLENACREMWRRWCAGKA
jgi:hypothetical protein